MGVLLGFVAIDVDSMPPISHLKSPSDKESASSAKENSNPLPASLRVVALLLVMVFLGSALPVAAEAQRQVQPLTLDSLIGSWLKRSNLAHSNIGVEVMELPSGRILYSLNSSRRFVSASTAKVLTTACAFDTIGSAYRYRTRLYGLGTIAGKKLRGDLIIAASGDPTFEQKDLHQLFSTLSQKGINEVEGSLYLNPIVGGFDHWEPAWLTEDWGQEWMPPSSNVIVDRNIAQGNLVVKGYKMQPPRSGHRK